MKIRVVVTGYGVVTPIGNNIETFKENVFSGVSGAGKITRINCDDLPTKIGAEVKNYVPKYRDVKISYALDAAREAIQMSKLKNQETSQAKSGLSIGIGLELFSMPDLILLHNSPENIEKNLTFLNTPSDLCTHLISKEHDLNRPPLIHISACAASTDAIGSAYRKISKGKWDIAIAGGTDSMLNPMGIAGFCRIGAMTTKNEIPENASTPFDKDRDGFLLGEGAGFLVLESYEHATTRGATILGEITGFGNSLDAYSISDPHPEGDGAYLSMSRAIKDAGINPLEISAISAHGTGTPKNDPAESKALRRILGDHYRNIPVFATKSLIGHLISAAGAVEIITSFLSFHEEGVHGTKNLKNVAEDCELMHVKVPFLKVGLKYILKNSFGFGGQNASIVLKKYEE